MSISPARAEKRLQATITLLTGAQNNVAAWKRDLAEFTRGFEDAAGAIEALDLAKVALDANKADLAEAEKDYAISVRALPTFDPEVEADSAKITLLLVKQEELKKLIAALDAAISAPGFKDYTAEREALAFQVETWLVKVRDAKEKLRQAETSLKMYESMRADQERALQVKIIAFPILASRHSEKSKRPGFRDTGAKHSKSSISSARLAAADVINSLAGVRVRATDQDALAAALRGTGSPTAIRRTDIAKLDEIGAEQRTMVSSHGT